GRSRAVGPPMADAQAQQHRAALRAYTLDAGRKDVDDAGPLRPLERDRHVPRHDADPHAPVHGRLEPARPELAPREPYEAEFVRLIVLDDPPVEYDAGVVSRAQGDVRTGQDLADTPLGLDAPVAHEQHSVGESRGLVDRVAHVEHRNPEIPVQ